MQLVYLVALRLEWTDADIPIAESLIVRCHSISERLDSLETPFSCQKFFANGLKPEK